MDTSDSTALLLQSHTIRSYLSHFSPQTPTTTLLKAAAIIGIHELVQKYTYKQLTLQVVIEEMEKCEEERKRKKIQRMGKTKYKQHPQLQQQQQQQQQYQYQYQYQQQHNPNINIPHHQNGKMQQRGGGERIAQGLGTYPIGQYSTPDTQHSISQQQYPQQLYHQAAPQIFSDPPIQQTQYQQPDQPIYSNDAYEEQAYAQAGDEAEDMYQSIIEYPAGKPSTPLEINDLADRTREHNSNRKYTKQAIDQHGDVINFIKPSVTLAIQQNNSELHQYIQQMEGDLPVIAEKITNISHRPRHRDRIHSSPSDRFLPRSKIVRVTKQKSSTPQWWTEMANNFVEPDNPKISLNESTQTLNNTPAPLPTKEQPRSTPTRGSIAFFVPVDSPAKPNTKSNEPPETKPAPPEPSPPRPRKTPSISPLEYYKESPSIAIPSPIDSPSWAVPDSCMPPSKPMTPLSSRGPETPQSEEEQHRPLPISFGHFNSQDDNVRSLPTSLTASSITQDVKISASDLHSNNQITVLESVISDGDFGAKSGDLMSLIGEIEAVDWLSEAGNWNAKRDDT